VHAILAGLLLIVATLAFSERAWAIAALAFLLAGVAAFYRHLPRPG
jgi:hypothetical protein